MPESHAERVLRARCAAHTRWSQETDRTAATAKARGAFIERFEREVDPDGVLDPGERARRAENARKAWYARLAFRSAQARRRRSALPTPSAPPELAVEAEAA